MTRSARTAITSGLVVVGLAGCSGAPSIEPRVQARLEMTGGPDYLAAAAGSVRVRKDDGTVVRIDPDDTTEIATIMTGEAPCQGLGADDACGRAPTAASSASTRRPQGRRDRGAVRHVHADTREVVEDLEAPEPSVTLRGRRRAGSGTRS